jgi:single-stranded DNA-binding protein
MLLKGTQIGVTGEISLRQYKAKDGTEKSSLECRVSTVSLLGGKSEGGAAKQAAKSDPMEGLESDSIPF